MCLGLPTAQTHCWCLQSAEQNKGGETRRQRERGRERERERERERKRENEGVRERFLFSKGGQNGWCMWRVGVCIMRVWEVTRVVQYVRGGPN